LTELFLYGFSTAAGQEGDVAIQPVCVDFDGVATEPLEAHAVIQALDCFCLFHGAPPFFW